MTDNQTRQCGGCQFWTLSTHDVGECKRHAPSSVWDAPYYAPNVTWPRTRKDDVCGDWQAKAA